MHKRRELLRPPMLLGVVALLAAVLWSAPASTAAGDVITSPDTVGDVGSDASLVLDVSGNPVVSYRDWTSRDLKVLHCGDPNCSSGNVITSPDTAGDVGRYTSLALDGSGNPVIAYYDSTNGDLKVLHCADPNCIAGTVITSPDTAGDVGTHTSIALDGSGNPVVSYYDESNADLKVLHCGDPNCSAGNVINTPDTAGQAGRQTSLVLDNSGNPVVSYWAFPDLRVLHCGDASCGSGNVINSPDLVSDTDGNTSLALDSGGIPVVSHYDSTNGDVRVVRCGDANCSSGNVVSIPDRVGDVGGYVSLALDGTSNPVVGYYDGSYDDLKVLHCGDAYCSTVAEASVGLVAIDTTISGNDDSTISAIDHCTSISDGASLTFDLVVKGIELEGIGGYQVDIDYDPSIISVTSVVDVDAAGSVPPDDVTIISRISSSGGLGFLSFSNTVVNPNSMTLSAVDATLVPDRPAIYELGEGVLARVTVLAIGNGVTNLDVGGPLGGADGFADVIINKFSSPYRLPVTTVQDGAIAVGEACPPLVMPSPTPPPTPPLGPTATPTPQPLGVGGIVELVSGPPNSPEAAGGGSADLLGIAAGASVAALAVALAVRLWCVGRRRPV